MKRSLVLLKPVIAGLIVAGIIVLVQRNINQVHVSAVKQSINIQLAIKQQVPLPYDSREEVKVSVSFSSIPSALYIRVIRETLCLFEISFEEQKEFEDCESIPLTLTKFFRTLFQTIISPNAP